MNAADSLPPGAPAGRVLSARQARLLTRSIIGLCIVALALIFQPFSLTLFGVGAGLVIVSGLALNLVPVCRAGVRVRSVVLVGLVILIVLVVVAGLAIASAYLYALYLRPR